MFYGLLSLSDPKFFFKLILEVIPEGDTSKGRPLKLRGKFTYKGEQNDSQGL